MQLKVLGINFKTSPLELREKVSFTQAAIPVAIQKIKEQKIPFFLPKPVDEDELFGVLQIIDTLDFFAE